VSGGAVARRVRPVGDALTIARLVLHDAIRRTMPATVDTLCAATGVSEPTIRRHLTQLERLRCVRRVSVMRCGSDLWGEHDGATWAHLVGE